mmetsp:Transcript_19153/g.19403  ORF Transcript_19153/g.19403 Transcript_19153/m.19403 type:complete len:152 (-) Transcript_19153:16-471(-)
MILLIFLYHATHSSAKKSTLSSSHPSRKNIKSVTDEECTSPTNDATSSLREGKHAHPSLNEDNLRIQQHETEVYGSNQGRNNNDTHQQQFLQINHSHNNNQYFQQESDAVIAGSMSTMTISNAIVIRWMCYRQLLPSLCLKTSEVILIVRL